MTKLAELKAAYEAIDPLAAAMWADQQFIKKAYGLTPALLAAANHLAECQELLHDYPWVYQECKRILENLK